MKIVVAEKISNSAVNLLREPEWVVITPEQLDGKLNEHLATADALVVRSALQVDAALLEHAPKLRVIGRAGVGVDNVELDAATRKGIAVMNTPGGNAVAVAEYTLGVMLAMARFVPVRLSRCMRESGTRKHCKDPSFEARLWASWAWERLGWKLPKGRECLGWK